MDAEGGGERGDVKEESRDKKVSVLAPSDLGATAGTPKETGSQRTAGATWAVKGARAPKGGRTGSEAREGGWGWKSTLTSLAKSRSHERGRAPPGSPRQDPENPTARASGEACIGHGRSHRGRRRRHGRRSAIPGAGGGQPCPRPQRPGEGEKGSLDLHEKTTGDPARALTEERVEAAEPRPRGEEQDSEGGQGQPWPSGEDVGPVPMLAPWSA